MPIIDRTRVVFNVDSDVGASTFALFEAPAQPNGEVWQITRVLFADKNIGDNISGGFLVDFGSGTDFEIIAQAFMTGNTLDLPMQVLTTGDGSARLRIYRENNSMSSKKMVAMVAAFKRL